MHAQHRVTKSLQRTHAHEGSLAEADFADVENLHLERVANRPLRSGPTCPIQEHKRSSNRSLECCRVFTHAASRICRYSAVRSSIQHIVPASATGSAESSKRIPVLPSSTI